MINNPRELSKILDTDHPAARAPAALPGEPSLPHVKMPAYGVFVASREFAAQAAERADIPGPDVRERDGRDAAEYRRHAV